ncbi:cupin domain-containing protein [Alterinioella nitratireducens]|jgi:quercetin dioxygenase-like cupin family protein|uniref:cupin domain-containing protein n=1 Tax=Alterinioella nitratireducens TaxID=2735915 RepID=UPI001F3CD8EF|nr:cupin domain-containing protein [Alterinioella nitratireducens]
MFTKLHNRPATTFVFGLATGLAAMAAGPVLATMTGPSEHVGLAVETLAELSAETMEATIGLEGYTMRMRAIEIAPGGQIAEHSHQDRPGIVTVIDGAWVEGQPNGEQTFEAATLGTFPEHEDTVHWVYNRSDAPATALVCDIAQEN